MPRKKQSQKQIVRASRPRAYDLAELNRSIEQAERWADLRAADEELSRFADALQDPSFLRERRRVLKQAAAYARQLKPLAKRNWRGVSAANLALLTTSYLAILAGVRQFLPARCATLPEATRRALYVALVILRALAYQIDPQVPVGMITLNMTLGPKALNEVAERFGPRGHVGVLCGILPLMANSWEELQPTLRALRGPVLARLPATEAMSTWLRERHAGGQAAADRDRQLDDEINAAVWLRVGGKMPWLEAAVRGLDGEWNIVPTEAAHRLQNAEVRRGRDRRSFEITLEKFRQEDELWPKSMREPLDRSIRNKAAAWQRFTERMRKDPRLRLAQEAILSDQTLKAFARSKGLTDRTLRNYIATYKCLFEEHFPQTLPISRPTPKRRSEY